MAVRCISLPRHQASRTPPHAVQARSGVVCNAPVRMPVRAWSFATWVRVEADAAAPTSPPGPAGALLVLARAQGEQLRGLALGLQGVHRHPFIMHTILPPTTLQRLRRFDGSAAPPREMPAQLAPGLLAPLLVHLQARSWRCTPGRRGTRRQHWASPCSRGPGTTWRWCTPTAVPCPLRSCTPTWTASPR